MYINRPTCAEALSGNLTMDSALVLCLFVSAFWMPLTLSQRELASCNIKFDCSPSPGKAYSVNGDFVPIMLGKAFLIENQTTADCSFNFTELLQQCYPEPPAVLSHMALVMKCSKRRHLVFDVKPHLTDYDNVLLQIQIHNCKLSLDDIDWIGSVVNFRVFLAFNTEILPSTLAGNYNHSYSGLQKIVTLSLSNSNSSNRLETFFPRPDVFKLMAEVVFHNMSIDKLPSDFSSRMPTLQSLDLLNNNLSFPPSFPWYGGDRTLPSNLTRTMVFNDRYTTLLGISLPPNLFRRAFHLGFNRLETLRGYNFTGRIQIITLPGNQLREFGEDVLAQVNGLEQLDLHKNNLTYLSPRALNHPGLVGLKGINLRGNQLESLSNNTFETLTNLTKINLANNKLTALHKGTFSMLLKLEVIHLENNQLAYITFGCFPDTPALKHLFLGNNMFTQIPADLLTLGSFEMIDLSSCKISLNNLNDTLTQVSIARLQDTSSRTRSVTLGDRNNFKRTRSYQKVINLKHNNVTRIPVYPNLPQFKLLFANFKLQLEDNPIDCSGSMSDFIMYMTKEVEKGNFEGTEYMFKDIKCARPLEFANKPVLSLDPIALFYQSNLSSCPSQCVCYQFVSRDEYMVNCSDSNLTSFPKDLPPRTVDLRLQHNNISTLHISASLPELRKLDISFNQISKIDADFFRMLPGLKYLNLKHNLLGSLPKSIRRLNIETLEIGENHFLCDCKMTWIKPWLLDNKIYIDNWHKLTCTYGSNKQSAIVKVKDKDFVCKSSYDWKLYLAIALGVVLLILLSGSILIYRFRFDIKALLFVRFNVKIFEKKVFLAPDVVLDTFILCSKRDNRWTEENIYKTLNSPAMFGSVALCRNDVLIGLTVEENFDLMIDNASKIVVVLCEDFFDDPLCVSGLEKAVRISLRMRTKSVVIVELKSYPSSSVRSACVHRFLRTQTKIKPVDNLFREKLVYSVARKDLNVNLRDNNTTEQRQKTPLWESRLYSRLPSTTTSYFHDIYLSCSDSDLMWARNNISGRLEEKALNICIPARDFIPGEPIDAQIVEKLATSRHVLLILSNNSVDIFQSFVFRMASETTVKEHRNYLLVVLLKDTVIERLGQKEQSYLNTHTYLREEDALWWEKLIRSIPSERQIKSVTAVASQSVDEHINVDMKEDI